MTPPYAADTRAKGWRFELDYEQIEQSSTWALAPPEAKPWLLMLWFTAWKQVPCGSLPSDQEVVAALIGIPPKLWAKHSKVLLRGWNDIGGRLYHDTLSKRVTEMMARRRSDSDRKAKERAAKLAESLATTAGVTPESRVTPAVLTPESSTDNRLPTTKEKLPSGVARKRASPPEPDRPEEVAEQVWNDWLALRAKKRAPVTETVLADAKREAGKAGMPLEAFLAKWCSRGSQGLEADWLTNGSAKPVVNRQLAIEAENRRVAAAWLQGEPS